MSNEEMVEDCQTHYNRLNGWEQDFIDSIDEQLQQGRELSDRQEEILIKIHRKTYR